MNVGKIAAQLGHAFLDSALSCLEHDPERFQSYKTLHGIKICLTARSEHALLRAHEEAVKAGLPCALITDLSYYGYDDPDLLGKPIVTALGIGPARRSEIDKITKRFQMLK